VAGGQALEPLTPRFVSVTYGPAARPASATLRPSAASRAETSLHAAASPDLRRAHTDQSIQSRAIIGRRGIRHIVALRGDAPPVRNTPPHPAAMPMPRS